MSEFDLAETDPYELSQLRLDELMHRIVSNVNHLTLFVHAELKATKSVLDSSQSQLADTEHKLELAEEDAEVTATVMAMQQKQISSQKGQPNSCYM